tara:strand:- start:4374 stop:5258 length:885 start_codon:yes stop_codon:yes gene_type:complete
MKAYMFPGQGTQFAGMGKDIYESSTLAKEMFDRANVILGFRITDIMFFGETIDLKQTKVTQPAIFLHSTILAKVMGDDFTPDMVAGHSLGEISALSAIGVLSFEDGLKLVSKRGLAMQTACENQASSMAAILGLDDKIVEDICQKSNGMVVTANYNCPKQVVISGTVEAVNNACKKLKEIGARRVLVLPVGGAFHSPLMEPARAELANAIENTVFNKPTCSVYQNIVAKAIKDPEKIKKHLISQLTAPVRWTQTMEQMIKDGASSFTEVGPGNVLQGLLKKVDRTIHTYSALRV